MTEIGQSTKAWSKSRGRDSQAINEEGLVGDRGDMSGSRLDQKGLDLIGNEDLTNQVEVWQGEGLT